MSQSVREWQATKFVSFSCCYTQSSSSAFKNKGKKEKEEENKKEEEEEEEEEEKQGLKIATPSRRSSIFI